MLEPGRLNRRVSIMRPPTTVDDFGHITGSWLLVARVWANMKPITGRERMRGGQQDVTLTHTIAVRYNPVLMPPRESSAWRIEYGDRLFNIVAAVEYDDDRQWIIFECTEGSVDGQ